MPKITYKKLYLACKTGGKAVVTKALQQDDAKRLFNRCHPQERSYPLHQALLNNHLQLAEQIVDNNLVELNLVDAKYRTPIKILLTGRKAGAVIADRLAKKLLRKRQIYSATLLKKMLFTVALQYQQVRSTQTEAEHRLLFAHFASRLTGVNILKLLNDNPGARFKYWSHTQAIQGKITVGGLYETVIIEAVNNDMRRRYAEDFKQRMSSKDFVLLYQVDTKKWYLYGYNNKSRYKEQEVIRGSKLDRQLRGKQYAEVTKLNKVTLWCSAANLFGRTSEEEHAKNVELTRWEGVIFLPLRIYAHLEILVKLYTDTAFNNLRQNQYQNYRECLEELLLEEVEMLRTQEERVFIPRYINPIAPEFGKFTKEIALRIAEHLLRLPRGKRYGMCSGCREHATYSYFSRGNNEIITRTQNLGAESQRHYEARGRFQITRSQISHCYPYLMSQSIAGFSNENGKGIAYLQLVIGNYNSVKKGYWDKRIYDTKKLNKHWGEAETKREVGHLAYPRQEVGNCVVWSILPRLLDTKKFFPIQQARLRFHNWVITQELVVVQELRNQNTRAMNQYWQISTITNLKRGERLLAYGPLARSGEKKIKTALQLRYRNSLVKLLYVEPDASREGEEEKRFPVKEAVFEFMKSDRRVLLLQGGSGVGKTIFGEYLLSKLWGELYKETVPIPLFIPLPILTDPKNNLMEEFLEQQLNLSKGEIAALKANREFIVYLDGYDEITERCNLYVSNNLYKWKAKFIISCRSQLLNSLGNYGPKFKPTLPGFKGYRDELFEELVLQEFTEAQIELYIERFSAQNPLPTWSAKRYRQALTKIANLQELNGNPFVLSIILDVLPGLHVKTEQYISKYQIYEKFVQKLFEGGYNRLLRAKKIAGNSDVIRDFWEFAQNLAFDMFTTGDKNEGGINTVFYQKEHVSKFRSKRKQVQAENKWKLYFGKGETLEQIRSGVPLKSVGKNRWGFIHKSIKEFFIAHLLLMTVQELDPQKISIRKIEHLNNKLLNPEFKIVEFMADVIAQDEELQNKLFAIVFYTRKNPRAARAAANAMTVLNCARVPFSRKDLSRTHFPGADITGASCHGSKFRESNLAETLFQNSFLIDADFSKAYVKNTRFGMMSYANNIGGDVLNLFEYKGKILALSVPKGTRANDPLVLWDIHSGKEIQKFKDGACYFIDYAYSSNGQYFASTHHDRKVLYDLHSGKILFGMSRWNLQLESKSVLFSADNKSIIFLENSTYDTHLISVDFTGKLIKACKIKKKQLERMLLIPGSSFVLLYSNPAEKSKEIILYDYQKNSIVRKFFVNIKYRKTIAISPNKEIMAVMGQLNGVVQIFNFQTGGILETLVHTDDSYSGSYGHYWQPLVFSHDGKILATAHLDATIKLWDTRTWECERIITMSNPHVIGLLFDCDDSAILAYSSRTVDGNSIDCWKIKERKSDLKRTGEHGKPILDLSFSEDKKFLISKDGLTKNTWTISDGVCKSSVEHGLTLRARFLVKGGIYFIEIRQPGKIRIAKSNCYIGELTCRHHLTLDRRMVRMSPTHKNILIFSLGHKLKFCNPEMYRCAGSIKIIHEIEIDAGIIDFAVKINPSAGNGDLLIIGDKDGFVHFYQADIPSTVYADKARTKCLFKLRVGKGISIVDVSEDWRFLVVGAYNGSIRCFQLDINSVPHSRLLWISKKKLMCDKLNIENAYGLSSQSTRLLKQYGAIGAPKPLSTIWPGKTFYRRNRMFKTVPVEMVTTQMQKMLQNIFGKRSAFEVVATNSKLQINFDYHKLQLGNKKVINSVRLALASFLEYKDSQKPVPVKKPKNSDPKNPHRCEINCSSLKEETANKFLSTRNAEKLRLDFQKTYNHYKRKLDRCNRTNLTKETNRLYQEMRKTEEEEEEILDV